MAIDDNGQSYIQKNLFIIINEIKISIECFRFADIRENREVFAGLFILKNENLCGNWMNQYPTLFPSFKSVDGLNLTKGFAGNQEKSLLNLTRMSQAYSEKPIICK